MSRNTSLITIHQGVKISTTWRDSVVSISTPSDWFGTLKFETVEAAKAGIDEVIATGDYEVRAGAFVLSASKAGK
jgi:hypothetical protein